MRRREQRVNDDCLKPQPPERPLSLLPPPPTHHPNKTHTHPHYRTCRPSHTTPARAAPSPAIPGHMHPHTRHYRTYRPSHTIPARAAPSPAIPTRHTRTHTPPDTIALAAPHPPGADEADPFDVSPGGSGGSDGAQGADDGVLLHSLPQTVHANPCGGVRVCACRGIAEFRCGQAEMTVGANPLTLTPRAGGGVD